MNTAGRLRILYWADMFWPYIGGIEVRGARLVKTLRDRGHEFLVISGHLGLDLPDRMLYADVPVHRFPFWRALASGDLDLFSRVRQQVAALKRAFRPDLVHLDYVSPSALFHLHTAVAHRAPLLVTVQQGGSIARQSGRDTVLGRTLAAADWVAFCSDAMRAETLAAVPVLGAPHSVIRNGVEMPALEPAPLSLAPPHLVCVGRLCEGKGFDLALRALAALGDRDPALRMTIAGDGPARDPLGSLAAALGVASRVDFVGWVHPDGVPALLNQATLVLCPSRAEAFGLVAAEAALMARPVIATRVGGLPEVVLDGETGVLVEPDDPAALAAGVAELLARPDRAVELGRRARARAQREFGWNRHVDAYEALYSTLAEEVTHAHV